MNQALKASSPTCQMLDPLPGAGAERPPAGDPVFEQLAQRNDELLAANAALSADYERVVADNDRLRGAISKARLYAGEHLPAGAGTGIVHILESALKEAV